MDDQVLFVENLKIVIESRAPDFSIVGVAYNGKDAVNLAIKLRPHIVLMDVHMPEMDGVDATERIMKACPGTSIIMLTKYDDDEYITAALQQGAVGYILKEIPPDKLITAVRGVSEGSFFLSPQVASRLIDLALGNRNRTGSASSTPASLNEWYHELSAREREVLDCIARGYDNKQIARKLSIAVQTVKNHVSSIYFKLGVHDRVRLIEAYHRYLGEKM